MLSRKNRPSREEISKIFKQAKREDTKNFSLLFLFAKETGVETPPKISISVSKKVAKTSAGRHEIKRKISNFLREFIVEQLPSNLRGVVSIKPNNGKMPSPSVIREELAQLFKPFM